ncbi:MAG: pantoate--beta-alanine ligase [Bacteroidia bacterium]|nr:pantoate--beta-alanine ligase [Bacteroidia bacterium]
MKIISTRVDLKQYLLSILQAGKSVGFVPTMGALHKGHLSLMQKAVAENDYGIASIFVNPTQFGQNEDFSQYPRTFEADCDLLKSAGIHAVFVPTTAEMYSPDEEIKIIFPSLTGILCDKFRPNHFEGVARVVAKLLLLVKPTRSYFGQKDYQQGILIQKLVQELCIDTEVIICPIIRDLDGLALSSRNRYLSESERKQALVLHQVLSQVRLAAQEGASLPLLNQLMETMFAQSDGYFQLQYAEIRNGYTLSGLDRIEHSQKPIALVAGYIGTTRLIDNMFLLE